MNSKMPAISVVSISSLFTAMALPGVSVAQVSVSAKSRALEEVVVTAQRREQSLQDVPVAVTVFNSLSLQESGTETIVELQKSSPNTTLQTSRGTNSTLTAYIRGIGQADPLWGFEPGVGLYVDDVYLARPQAGVLDVIDVDRIEILRGPQGTLYGKNTIGGAVKYVTKKLSGERELSVKGVLGNYGQTDVKISAQMPLIDNTLSIGGAVASLQRDGFGEFILNGNDNYNKDVTAARISLEYTPSDRWFIRLSADDIQDDSNAKGGHRLTDSLITMEKPLNNVYDTRADMSTDN
ncbi:MAG: TonB-dependent receptor plug domain-containing protein [Exilibacterium sp.]